MRFFILLFLLFAVSTGYSQPTLKEKRDFLMQQRSIARGKRKTIDDAIALAESKELAQVPKSKKRRGK